MPRHCRGGPEDFEGTVAIGLNVSITIANGPPSGGPLQSLSLSLVVVREFCKSVRRIRRERRELDRLPEEWAFSFACVFHRFPVGWRGEHDVRGACSCAFERTVLWTLDAFELDYR